MVKLMVEIRKLLEYNENVRHRYFEALAKLPWDEFVKNREASFHSLRNIFVHTLGATDYWLDFLQKEDRHSHKKFNEYQTVQDVRAYMEHVEKRMRNYLDSLLLGDSRRSILLQTMRTKLLKSQQKTF